MPKTKVSKKQVKAWAIVWKTDWTTIALVETTLNRAVNKLKEFTTPDKFIVITVSITPLSITPLKKK